MGIFEKFVKTLIHSRLLLKTKMNICEIRKITSYVVWKVRSHGNIALSVLCYIFSKVSYFPVGYATEIKACPPKK